MFPSAMAQCHVESNLPLTFVIAASWAQLHPLRTVFSMIGVASQKSCAHYLACKCEHVCPIQTHGGTRFANPCQGFCKNHPCVGRTCLIPFGSIWHFTRSMVEERSREKHSAGTQEVGLGKCSHTKKAYNGNIHQYTEYVF